MDVQVTEGRRDHFALPVVGIIKSAVGSPAYVDADMIAARLKEPPLLSGAYLGVDPARMAVIGFGEYRPVADNALEAGRNRNRRVQLIVSASQVTAPAVRESVAPGIAPIPQAVVPSAAGRP